jgi:UrcA family protein
MKKLALSLALTSLALAAPALAGPMEMAKSTTVRASDLDLSNPADVQALYGRIHSAARRVCADLAGPGATMRVELRACMRTAMDSGVLSANSAALSALHLDATGRAPSAVAAK